MATSKPNMEHNPNEELWRAGVAILEDNVFEKKAAPGEAAFVERRKHTRVAVSVPLKFRVTKVPDQWKPVESIDVSNSGVRLAVAEKVPLNTQIELEVQLPDNSQPMRVDGLVVWVSPARNEQGVYECGIAFENVQKLTRRQKFVYFMADRLCKHAIRRSPQDLVSRPAETLEELKAAYRLVYKEYEVRGYCEKNAAKMHYSYYCMLPESRTFIMERNKHLLGTISLIVDSTCGLPMETLFPEEVQSFRRKNRKLAEVSLLSLDHEAFRKRSYSLTDFEKMTGTFWLFKIMFEYARQVAGVTDILIAVHPKHEDLYTYLTFKKMAKPRSYATAQGKPALPLRLDIERAWVNLHPGRSLKKYFFDLKAPVAMLERHFTWDRHSLKEMMVDTKPLWQKLPTAYQRHFKRTYPDFDPDQA